ncbi:MAG TPA: hypothetical protein VE956_17740 [Nodularia sp. (in: cyanobacteria)]|nr:hypothetical protein [Nodularia sp. (in: cyanobacteria)]
MEQNQDQQRHAADKQFQKSLEHLEDILQDSSTTDEVKPKLNHRSSNEAELMEGLTDIDLADFEDAVADIEAYLDRISKK